MKLQPESYQRNTRYYYVNVNYVLEMKTNMGSIPQGYIICPLCFIYIINDLSLLYILMNSL